MYDATSTMTVDGLAPRRGLRRKPAEYRIYFAIVFAVALPVAIIGRLFPRQLLRAEAEQGERRSVWAEARALTNTVIPYLFMG